MSNHMRMILIAGIGSVLTVLALYLIYNKSANGQTDALYLLNKNYILQTALFSNYKTDHADVVMLGNSLTQWVDWNELLGRKNIVNRGIAGDITEGYLKRLDQVLSLKPRLCFIEGGINDIYANVPVRIVFENYVKIVETLRSHNITPIVQSTLFVSPKWHSAAQKNKEVAHLDKLLEEYAKKNNIEFLDLNAVMSTNNELRDELTHDGVHLNADGYTIWGSEVDKILKKYDL